MFFKWLLSIVLIFVSGSYLYSQSILDLLDEEERTDYTIATFKTTRLINGHSIETNAGGVLLFLIQHRFGRLNGGAYEFFGLDNSTTRLALEYGITDNLDIGIGRSTFEKTMDGFLKYKLLRQSTGKKNMPLTLTLFTGIAVKTLRWQQPNRTNYFSSKLYYTFQVLAARKISTNFSIQLSPTLIHRNLVAVKEDKNDVFAVGIGGRYKLSGSFSINAEYFYVFPNQIVSEINGEKVHNSLSVGVDIETGGHVFQLHLTNSRGMIEKFFVTETTGSWANGDIHFGFNISRVFTIVDKTKKKLEEEKEKRENG